MRKVQLREIAFSRAGDKGDTSNVSVIPYNEAYYELVKAQVTVERVKQAYGALVKGEVRRYELPGAKALNFVMEHALDGGVSRSLGLDLHGKSRGSVMGTIEIELPEA